MTGTWGAPKPPAPPPSRAPFVATVTVGGLAVAGMVAMLIWSGGDAPASGSTPGDPQAAVSIPRAPGGSADGDSGPSLGVITVEPPAAAQDGPARPTTTAGGQPAGADAAPAAEALIASLPEPRRGVAQPSDSPGLRHWLVPNANWEAVRDRYIADLEARGLTVTFVEGAKAEGADGEIYSITDPQSGVAVELAVAGPIDGQTAVEVTHP